jgi:hypothetical protein
MDDLTENIKLNLGKELVRQYMIEVQYSLPRLLDLNQTEGLYLGFHIDREVCLCTSFEDHITE